MKRVLKEEQTTFDNKKTQMYQFGTHGDNIRLLSVTCQGVFEGDPTPPQLIFVWEISRGYQGRLRSIIVGEPSPKKVCL